MLGHVNWQGWTRAARSSSAGDRLYLPAPQPVQLPHGSGERAYGLPVCWPRWVRPRHTGGVREHSRGAWPGRSARITCRPRLWGPAATGGDRPGPRQPAPRSYSPDEPSSCGPRRGLGRDGHASPEQNGQWPDANDRRGSSPTTVLPFLNMPIVSSTWSTVGSPSNVRPKELVRIPKIPSRSANWKAFGDLTLTRIAGAA